MTRTDQNGDHYQKADPKICPLCLRKAERMVDGYCWRCTAMAADFEPKGDVRDGT